MYLTASWDGMNQASMMAWYGVFSGSCEFIARQLASVYSFTLNNYLSARMLRRRLAEASLPTVNGIKIKRDQLLEDSEMILQIS
jgi:hypothetical protein